MSKHNRKKNHIDELSVNAGIPKQLMLNLKLQKKHLLWNKKKYDKSFNFPNQDPLIYGSTSNCFRSPLSNSKNKL